MFHALTGLYCPGCGGTRSVYLLLTGHPLRSLLYHPITLYAAVAIAYLGIRLLWEFLFSGKFLSLINRSAGQRHCNGQHSSNGQQPHNSQTVASAPYKKPYKKKYHPSSAWLWVALAIVLINWLVKNLFLIVWNIDLLS